MLELRIPSGLSESELFAALRGQGPQLFSFVLSFLVIGRFWMSHHRMFSHLTGSDDRLLVLNLVFLLSVVFLPFPTAVLGEYMHYRSALLLYAGSVALAGTLFTALWAHAAYIGELVSGVDTRLRRLLLLRFGSVPVVFVATMPVITLGWRHVAVALWILVPRPCGCCSAGATADRPPDPPNRLGPLASPDLRRPGTARSPKTTTLRGGGPGPRRLPGRVQPLNATKG